MKWRLNSYFAVLIITIFGAFASWLIVHVAYANTFATTMGGSEAGYSSLQQSILEN